MKTGQVTLPIHQSLDAFWPGLQVRHVAVYYCHKPSVEIRMLNLGRRFFRLPLRFSRTFSNYFRINTPLLC